MDLSLLTSSNNTEPQSQDPSTIVQSLRIPGTSDQSTTFSWETGPANTGNDDHYSARELPDHGVQEEERHRVSRGLPDVVPPAGGIVAVNPRVDQQAVNSQSGNRVFIDYEFDWEGDWGPALAFSDHWFASPDAEKGRFCVQDQSDSLIVHKLIWRGATDESRRIVRFQCGYCGSRISLFKSDRLVAKSLIERHLDTQRCNRSAEESRQSRQNERALQSVGPRTAPDLHRHQSAEQQGPCDYMAIDTPANQGLQRSPSGALQPQYEPQCEAEEDIPRLIFYYDTKCDHLAEACFRRGRSFTTSEMRPPFPALVIEMRDWRSENTVFVEYRAGWNQNFDTYALLFAWTRPDRFGEHVDLIRTNEGFVCQWKISLCRDNRHVDPREEWNPLPVAVNHSSQRQVHQQFRERGTHERSIKKEDTSSEFSLQVAAEVPPWVVTASPEKPTKETVLPVPNLRLDGVNLRKKSLDVALEYLKPGADLRKLIAHFVSDDNIAGIHFGRSFSKFGAACSLVLECRTPEYANTLHTEISDGSIRHLRDCFVQGQVEPRFGRGLMDVRFDQTSKEGSMHGGCNMEVGTCFKQASNFARIVPVRPLLEKGTLVEVKQENSWVRAIVQNHVAETRDVIDIEPYFEDEKRTRKTIHRVAFTLVRQGLDKDDYSSDEDILKTLIGSSPSDDWTFLVCMEYPWLEDGEAYMKREAELWFSRKGAKELDLDLDEDQSDLDLVIVRVRYDTSWFSSQHGSPTATIRQAAIERCDSITWKSRRDKWQDASRWYPSKSLHCFNLPLSGWHWRSNPDYLGVFSELLQCNDNTKLAFSLPMAAQQFALLIAQSEYENGWDKLPAAREDAILLARTLRSKGFYVELVQNLKTKEEIDLAVRKFAKGLHEGCYYMCWYAGHGVQYKGNHYFMPTGASYPEGRWNPFTSTDYKSDSFKSELCTSVLETGFLSSSINDCFNENISAGSLGLRIFDCCRTDLDLQEELHPPSNLSDPQCKSRDAPDPSKTQAKNTKGAALLREVVVWTPGTVYDLWGCRENQRSYESVASEAHLPATNFVPTGLFSREFVHILQSEEHELLICDLVAKLGSAMQQYSRLKQHPELPWVHDRCAKLSFRNEIEKGPNCEPLTVNLEFIAQSQILQDRQQYLDALWAWLRSQDGTRCFICGLRGSGKSVLARLFCETVIRAGTHRNVFIIIRARQWVEDIKRTLGLLNHDEGTICTDSNGELWSLCNLLFTKLKHWRGQWLLVVDGLDPFCPRDFYKFFLTQLPFDFGKTIFTGQEKDLLKDGDQRCLRQPGDTVIQVGDLLEDEAISLWQNITKSYEDVDKIRALFRKVGLFPQTCAQASMFARKANLGPDLRKINEAVWTPQGVEMLTREYQLGDTFLGMVSTKLKTMDPQTFQLLCMLSFFDENIPVDVLNKEETSLLRNSGFLAFLDKSDRPAMMRRHDGKQIESLADSNRSSRGYLYPQIGKAIRCLYDVQVLGPFFDMGVARLWRKMQNFDTNSPMTYHIGNEYGEHSFTAMDRALKLRMIGSDKPAEWEYTPEAELLGIRAAAYFGRVECDYGKASMLLANSLKLMKRRRGCKRENEKENTVTNLSVHQGVASLCMVLGDDYCEAAECLARMQNHLCSTSGIDDILQRNIDDLQHHIKCLQALSHGTVMECLNVDKDVEVLPSCNPSHQPETACQTLYPEARVAAGTHHTPLVLDQSWVKQMGTEFSVLEKSMDQKLKHLGLSKLEYDNNFSKESATSEQVFWIVKRLEMCDSAPSESNTRARSIVQWLHFANEMQNTSAQQEDTLLTEARGLLRKHMELHTTFGQVGEWLYGMGLIHEAKQFFRASLHLASTIFHKHHIDVATAQFNLGLMWVATESWSEALIMFRRCLQIREEKLPPNHFETVRTMQHIAGVFLALTQYTKAYEQLEQALQCVQARLTSVQKPCRSFCHAFHSEELASIQQRMGDVYYQQRNYYEALQFHQKAVQTLDQIACQRVDGEPINTSQAELAGPQPNLQVDPGRIEFSSGGQESSTSASKRGPCVASHHLSAQELKARILVSTAGIYVKLSNQKGHEVRTCDEAHQFRWLDQAEQSFLKAICIYSSLERNSEAALTLQKLGVVWRKQNKVEQAHEIHQNLLDQWPQVSPHQSKIRRATSLLHCGINKSQDLQLYLGQASKEFQEFVQQFDESSKPRGSSRRDYEVYWFRSDFKEYFNALYVAGETARRELRETDLAKKLFEEHIKGHLKWVGSCSGNLANSHQNLAEMSIEDLAPDKIGDFGTNHSEYECEGKALTEALQSYYECIKILGARYGVDSSRVADVKGRCAWILRILGHNEPAISYLEDAIAAIKRDNPTLGCSLHEIPSRSVSCTKDLVILHRNLGAAYHNTGEHLKARKALDTALGLAKELESLEKPHHTEAPTLVHLGDSYFFHNPKNLDKAIEYYKQAHERMTFKKGQNANFQDKAKISVCLKLLEAKKKLRSSLQKIPEEDVEKLVEEILCLIRSHFNRASKHHADATKVHSAVAKKEPKKEPKDAGQETKMIPARVVSKLKDCVRYCQEVVNQLRLLVVGMKRKELRILWKESHDMLQEKVLELETIDL